MTEGRGGMECVCVCVRGVGGGGGGRNNFQKIHFWAGPEEPAQGSSQ